MFSRRTEHPRTPNAIALAIEAARASGRPLLDLTIANPTEVGLGLDAEALRASLSALALDRYRPDPRGRLATRERIGRELGVAPDRVQLVASTSEGYSFAFATLCDPGDRVLVPRPSYPLLEWLAKIAAIELVPYDLAYDGEWYVDLASLDAARDERTRAVVAVSPNNPTGSWLSVAERDAILDRGLPLIVDEVFAAYPLERALPIHEPATHGLVLRLSGLSKLAALPQMKLGFVALEGDPALIDEALARLELLGDTYLSVSTPAELAAPAWLDAAPAIRARIVERCRANLRALDRAIEGTTITRLRADAGWYAILRLPGVASEDELVLDALDEGVIVQPGWFYDLSRGPHAVVSLIVPEADHAEGTRRLVRAIERRAAQSR